MRQRRPTFIDEDEKEYADEHHEPVVMTLEQRRLAEMRIAVTLKQALLERDID